jgi:hypothetical protein
MSTQTDAGEVRNIHNLRRFGLTTFIMIALHWRRKRCCCSGFKDVGEQQFCNNGTFIPLRGRRGGQISLHHPSSFTIDVTLTQPKNEDNMDHTKISCEAIQIMHLKERYSR